MGKRGGLLGNAAKAAAGALAKRRCTSKTSVPERVEQESALVVAPELPPIPEAEPEHVEWEDSDMDDNEQPEEECEEEQAPVTPQNPKKAGLLLCVICSRSAKDPRDFSSTWHGPATRFGHPLH